MPNPMELVSRLYEASSASSVSAPSPKKRLVRVRVWEMVIPKKSRSPCSTPLSGWSLWASQFCQAMENLSCPSEVNVAQMCASWLRRLVRKSMSVIANPPPVPPCIPQKMPILLNLSTTVTRISVYILGKM